MRSVFCTLVASCLLSIGVLGPAMDAFTSNAVSEEEAATVFGGVCDNYKSVDGCGDGGQCDLHTSYNITLTNGTNTGDHTTNFPCLGGDCGSYESLAPCTQG